MWPSLESKRKITIKAKNKVVRNNQIIGNKVARNRRIT